MLRAIPTHPSIRGQRVWLRPIDEGDLDDYLAAIVSVEPGWHAGYNGAGDAASVRRWFDDVVTPGQRSAGYWFTICPIESDDFLGQVWLWNLNGRVPGAEISIFVTQPGQGVGVDAINAAVDFGFSSAGLHRIWGYTRATNSRSVAAFERCGFVVEGTIRGGVHEGGQLRDLVQFSITSADWTGLERRRWLGHDWSS